MPNEYPFKATFQEMTDLRDGLIALREKSYMQTDVESLVKYSWAIKDTEETLAKRARVADTLRRLFDVTVDTTDDVKAVTAIAEAKRQKADLEALEAAEAALDA